MASAFFAGFADTLKDIRLDDRKRTRDLEDADALQRLKKKYESEIVDNQATRIVGSDEIRYNKFGDEISRRTLSPEELSARKAELAKTEADARKAGAEADMSVKDRDFYDEDRSLDVEEKRSIRAAREAGVAQGWAGVANSTRGLDLQEARLNKEGEDEVTALLYEADGAGDSSAAALQKRYLMRLEQATTKAQKQQIIAEYKGIARNLLAKIRQANAIEVKRAGGATFALPPAP